MREPNHSLLDLKLEPGTNGNARNLKWMTADPSGRAWPRFLVFFIIAMASIPVLLNDSFFAVINKPSGLFTQAASGIESVESVLREQWKLPDHQATPFVGLPHRLDRGTSGTLIIARNQRSLQRLGEQFHSRKVHKRYLAAVQGIPQEKVGTWIDYLRKIPDRPVAEITEPGVEGAKIAELDYRFLCSSADVSLLDIELKTGRMHQIRIQAASRGHSVLGDWCYGNQTVWGEIDHRGERIALALHAAAIQFRNPQNARPIQVAAPLPQLWRENLPLPLVTAATEFLNQFPLIQ
jgi:RluA family pseudouridine synthase